MISVKFLLYKTPSYALKVGFPGSTVKLSNIVQAEKISESKLIIVTGIQYDVIDLL